MGHIRFHFWVSDLTRSSISLTFTFERADGELICSVCQGHRTSAAIDMKLTTLDLFLLQQFIAIGGPTYDPLPPFEFSKSDLKDKPHWGIPEKSEFEPLVHHWKW